MAHRNGKEHTVFNESADILAGTHRIHTMDSRLKKSTDTETISYGRMAGEHDLILPEYARRISDSIFDSIPEIIPGENHGSCIVHSRRLSSNIRKYL